VQPLSRLGDGRGGIALAQRHRSSRKGLVVLGSYAISGVPKPHNANWISCRPVQPLPDGTYHHLASDCTPVRSA
jgi:hypothetical protein